MLSLQTVSCSRETPATANMNRLEILEGTINYSVAKYTGETLLILHMKTDCWSGRQTACDGAGSDFKKKQIVKWGANDPWGSQSLNHKDKEDELQHYDSIALSTYFYSYFLLSLDPWSSKLIIK